MVITGNCVHNIYFSLIGVEIINLSFSNHINFGGKYAKIPIEINLFCLLAELFTDSIFFKYLATTMYSKSPMESDFEKSESKNFHIFQKSLI